MQAIPQCKQDSLYTASLLKNFLFVVVSNPCLVVCRNKCASVKEGKEGGRERGEWYFSFRVSYSVELESMFLFWKVRL